MEDQQHRIFFERACNAIKGTLRQQFGLIDRVRVEREVLLPPLPKGKIWFENRHPESQRKLLTDYKCSICKNDITDVNADKWFYMLRAHKSCPPSHAFCVYCLPQFHHVKNDKFVCVCPAHDCEKTYLLEDTQLDPIPKNIWIEAQRIQNEEFDNLKRKKEATKSLKEMDRLIRKRLRGGEKKCRECFKTFRGRYQKILHLREKHGVGIVYECKLCEIRFKNKTALDYHQKVVCQTLLRDLKSRCPKCDCKFVRPRNVRRHFETCSTTKL